MSIKSTIRGQVIGLPREVSIAVSFVEFAAAIYAGKIPPGTNLTNVLLVGEGGTGKTNLARAMGEALCQYAGFSAFVPIDSKGTPGQVLHAIQAALDEHKRVVFFLDEYHKCKKAADDLKEIMACGNAGRVNYSMKYGAADEIQITFNARDVIFICSSNKKPADETLEQRARSGAYIEIPLYNDVEKLALFDYIARRDKLQTLPTRAVVKYLCERTRPTGRAIEELVTELRTEIMQPVRTMPQAREHCLKYQRYAGGLNIRHVKILEFLARSNKQARADSEIAGALKSTKTADSRLLIAEINTLSPCMILKVKGGRILGADGWQYIADNIETKGAQCYA